MFPAHAGMILADALIDWDINGVPRARGDDPFYFFHRAYIGLVFPAHAGMIPQVLSEASEEEIALIQTWTDDSTDYRLASRGDPSADAEDIEAAMQLDAYIARGKYEQTIYRGINVDDNVIASFQIGAEIDQLGISSWSKLEDIAKEFAQPKHKTQGNMVILTMGKGTKMGKDISKYSTKPHEEEVLVSLKSKQVINDMRNVGDILYVDVEEV